MTTSISVAVVLLAAGKAQRMGPAHHKLLAEFDGEPLVRRMAQVAINARPSDIVVVTGYRHEDISACLSELRVDVVVNPAYASGIASSIVAGFEASSVSRSDGVMIMLADMPEVTSHDLQILMEAFRAADGKAVVRAASGGRRGNPVVLPRSLRPGILQLTGDVGARHIIDTCDLEVIDVEIGEAAHLDVDTVEAVIAAGGVLRG